MKLLRVGDPNQETVAALDKNNKLRDLSNQINDLNPKTLNENTLKKLKQIDLSKLTTGIYYLSIDNGKQKSVQKIVKR